MWPIIPLGVWTQKTAPQTAGAPQLHQVPPAPAICVGLAASARATLG
jgi:hypothetical protein